MTKQTGRVPGSRGAMCLTSAGKPCNGQPLKGSDPPMCVRHLPNPKARANAAVRAAVRLWEDHDQPLDPGDLLSRAMTVTWWQVERHRAALAEQAKNGADPYVQWTEQGQKPTALAVLEQRERQMAADMAVRGVAAGLAQRDLEMRESAARIVVQVLRASLPELGVDLHDDIVGEVIGKHLRAIESGAA